MVSIVNHLKKPTVEINKFNGNPLDNRRFLRQFKTVTSSIESADERMTYLEQYTEGKPSEIVRAYSYMSADKGYTTAMKELEERYGDVEVVANAFISKALSWPNMKPDNGKALDECSVFLTECQNAIKCIDAVKISEFSDNMKNFVGKLPFYMHYKWCNIVQCSKEKGKAVEFTE